MFETCLDVKFSVAHAFLEHACHWDSGSYSFARLPIIGAIIRFFRKRAG